MRIMQWTQCSILGAVYSGVLLSSACGSDTTGPSSPRLVRHLQLNHHAVTLATVAPYNTIHLSATVTDQTGAVLMPTTQPIYTTSDTSITIDSTGLVRVHRIGDATGITVTAMVHLGSGVTSLTLADTAVFNVVTFASMGEVPQLYALHLQPFAGDSARQAVIDTGGVPGLQTLDSAVAVTAAGEVIEHAIVRYRTSDSLVASFVSPTGLSTEAPQVNANAPGVVLLTAEATVYGTRKVDSLWYTVGYPLRVVCTYGVGEFFKNTSVSFSLPARNFLSLGQLAVGQGGAVLWDNTTVGKTDDSLDIVFDDPTKASVLTAPATFPDAVNGSVTIPASAGGNIPAFPAATVQPFFGPFVAMMVDSTTAKARVFTQPGTYAWSSHHQGIRGTVIVFSNDSMQHH